MAAIAQAQAGDHNLIATWIGGVVPTVGDSVISTYALNIVSDWDIGHSPAQGDTVGAFLFNANGATLIISPNVKITHRGDFNIAQGDVIVGDGVTFYADSSLATTPLSQSYELDFASVSGTRRNVTVNAAGAAQNYIEIDSNPLGGRVRVTMISGIKNLVLSRIYFTNRVDTVRLEVADLNLNSVVEMCEFRTFGAISVFLGTNTKFRKNIVFGPVATSHILFEILPTVYTDLTNNVLRCGVYFRYNKFMDISGCVFEWMQTGSGCVDTWAGLDNMTLIVKKVLPTANLKFNLSKGIVKDCLMYASTGPVATHSEGAIDNSGTVSIDGLFLQHDGSPTQYHRIWGNTINQDAAVVGGNFARKCIIAKNAIGLESGQLTIYKGTRYTSSDIYNNTIFMSTPMEDGFKPIGTGIGEAARGWLHMIAGLRNNLCVTVDDGDNNSFTQLIKSSTTSISRSGTGLAGSTDTILVSTSGLFEYNGLEYQDLSGSYRVKMTSGPDIGLVRDVVASTINSVTLSLAFPNTMLGETFICFSVDHIKPDAVSNNAFYGLSSDGIIYDENLDTVTTTKVGYAHFATSTPVAIGANDIIGLRGDVSFLDLNRSIATYATEVLALPVGSAWVSGTPYVDGDIVSITRSDFFNNQSVNFVCILDTASIEPGHYTTEWRDNWEMQTIVEMQKATIGTFDSIAGAAQPNVLAWVTAGYAPTTQTLSGAGYDASDIGAVPVATIAHTVNFDQQGATVNSDPITAEVNDGESIGTLPTPPTKTGYTFGGWFTAVSGGGTEFLSSTIVSAPITVYAYWVIVDYNITYNLDGGVNAVGNPATYNIESAEIIFDPATKNGYNFNVWSVLSIPAGSTGAVSTSASFVAIDYNITYVLNGGINDPLNPNTYNIDDVEINFLTPTKLGYNFVGWTVATILAGSTGAVTTEVSWSLIDYTIDYTNTHGVANTNPATYTIEDAEVFFTPLVDDGYTFDGFTPLSIPTGSTGNGSVAAAWTVIDYAINYTLNGGINAVDNPATYNIEDTEIVFSDPTREGYTFVAWTVSVIAAGSFGVIDTSASWLIIPDTFAVTYDGNTNTGGAVPVDSTNYEALDTVTVLSNSGSLAKTGYNLTGWNTLASGLGTQYAPAETFSMPAGNVTLYAVWVEGAQPTADVFSLTPQKLSTGKINLKWRFDPKQISAVSGDFYLVRIILNEDEIADTGKADIQFIVKIKNSFETGV